MRSGEVLFRKYRLGRPLARGAMGEVWQAHDLLLERDVAIKAPLGVDLGDELLARLKNEAVIGARLRHPGITTVYAAELGENRLFIIMELLEGEDLARLLARSRSGLLPVQAVGLARQAADALAAIHTQAIVHRDLKPANLFLLGNGVLKICDFGIARSAHTGSGLESSGSIMGTAPYMAPEQWRGRDITDRTDMYALGCVLYELLAGNPPFPSTGDLMALRQRHFDETPASLRSVLTGAPADLGALVAELLAKEWDARPDAHTTFTRLRAIEQALLGPHEEPTATQSTSADSGSRSSHAPRPPRPPRSSGPPRPPGPPHSNRYDHLRDPGRLVPVHRLTEPNFAGSVRAVAFSPDGASLAAGSSSWRGTAPPVQLWNPRARQLSRKGLKSDGVFGEANHRSKAGVCSVAFSADGTLLVAGGTDGTVRTWDLHNRKPLHEFSAMSKPMWSARHKRSLSDALDGFSMKIRDPRSWKPLGDAIKGVFASEVMVAISPDGAMLATTCSDDKVRLWDSRTGRPIGEPLTGHTDDVSALAFSPDGSLLATAGKDGTARLWSPQNGQPAGEPLINISEPVLALAFSPDGTRLAAAGGEDQVRMWDLRDRRSVGGEPFVGHIGHVAALAFSPDGSLLAAGGSAKTLWFWDACTRRPVGRPLTDHTDAIRGLTFSPDGTLLATTDGNLRLWEVASPTR